MGLKDFDRGREYFRDVAVREGVPVTDNLTEAFAAVLEKI